MKSTFRTFRVTAAAAITGIFDAIMNPGDAAIELKRGDTAPDFSLPGSDGKTYRLHDLAGQIVVLAWFPKAFTGG